MHRIRTITLVCLVLLSTFLVLPPRPIAYAAEGKADVYVICLPDVPTENSLVSSPTNVVEGAIDACMVDGSEIDSDIPWVHPKDGTVVPYHNPSLHVVTDWYSYKSIVTTQSEVIVINAHGQYLPVPSSYSRESWVRKIADAMNQRRLTWAHIGGYPFNYTYYQQNGTSELWGTGGFQYLMEYGLNLANVNCMPPEGVENEKALVDLDGFEQISFSWSDFGSNYRKVNVGKPLKLSDFKEYLAMWLYTSTWGNEKYLSGAVVVFGKAGSRYTDARGCGAYIHIGSSKVYNKLDEEQPADFARGYIATAVALWYEVSGFSPSSDVEDYNRGPYSGKIGISVCPSIIRLHKSGGHYYIKLAFPIVGTLSVNEDDSDFYLEGSTLRVWVHSVSGEFSDITMIVNKPMSKGGEGDAPVFSGLYPENGKTEEFVASSILWVLSAAPKIGWIVWAIEGVLLLSNYYQLLGWTGTGVSDYFEPYIEAWCPSPLPYEEVRDDILYQEMTAIIVAELKVNSEGRQGWKTFPLTYTIGITPLESSIYIPSVETTDTLNIALYFGAPGQDDRYSGNDAGDNFNDATSIGTLNNFFGYLGGDDYEDWYLFQVEPEDVGKLLDVTITPPTYVNFDLELYDQLGSYRSGSYNGVGNQERILYGVNSSGPWRIRIFKVNGSGVYSCNVRYQVGGCPTLFVWNGTDYAEEGILNIHAESDITIQHAIWNTLALNKGVYKLQLRELDEFTSHIDQVKLYAVDGEEVWHNCPLIHAYHTELGKVTWKLIFDDDNRVDLEPTEIIDLKFLPSIPYHETAYFIFEINGHNPKPPSDVG